MKILNLYAGIGGNRKLWEGHEVTAVENVDYIADAYAKMYPDDTLVRADAHQYLLDHYKEFDFIWSSPPCPTHSRVNLGLQGWGIHRYPDMGLYQEIIFLKHFFKGKWIVENVVAYYEPLIRPNATLNRHWFWSNFDISDYKIASPDVTRSTKETLAAYQDIQLPEGTKDQRKLLRNAVHPLIGQHVLNESEDKQLTILANGEK